MYPHKDLQKYKVCHTKTMHKYLFGTVDSGQGGECDPLWSTICPAHHIFLHTKPCWHITEVVKTPIIIKLKHQETQCHAHSLL